jgi:hypothetical protein
MIRSKLLLPALALLVFLPSAANAQGITGDWEVTVESPQGPATIDAAFKQDGEAVVGTVTSPMGSVEFKGTLVNDAITVNYQLDLQGNLLDVTMNGKVAGDAMEGNLVIAGMGELPWKAKRKAPGAAATAAAAAPAAPAAAVAPGAATAAAAAPVDPADISGKWNVMLSMAGAGEFPLSMTLTHAGDKISGTLSSAMGDTQVAGTMTGTVLKLDFVAATPQGDIPVVFTGDLGPTGFKGKAAMAGLGEADWTGTREP